MHLFFSESLSGKNVLITGASRGIGKALALQYARFGANVMLTARNESALKEVSKVTEVKLQERVDCLKVRGVFQNFRCFEQNWNKEETL